MDPNLAFTPSRTSENFFERSSGLKSRSAFPVLSDRICLMYRSQLFVTHCAIYWNFRSERISQCLWNGKLPWKIGLKKFAPLTTVRHCFLITSKSAKWAQQCSNDDFGCYWFIILQFIFHKFSWSEEAVHMFCLPFHVSNLESLNFEIKCSMLEF